MSDDQVARLYREVLDRVEDQDRRIESIAMVGKVKKTEGRLTQVEFEGGVDGKTWTTPQLRQAAHAGAKKKGLARFSPHTDGETVLVLSPSGEVGEGSRVLPWGETDDNPAPGKEAADGEVITIGDATFTVKNGEVSGAIGKSSFKLTDGAFTGEVDGKSFKVSAQGIDFKGGKVTHDGKSIGVDHKHTQVLPGGGQSGPPA